MPNTNPKTKSTRERLLIAASQTFAEKGFQEATIAEICERAKTNIASVNYHFRDKENLYLEAWRFAFYQDLAAYPADGGIQADAPAANRLAGRIKSLMARIADENSHFFAIINKEMTHPTRLLSEIMEKEINPQRLAMMALIRELLGEAASEQTVQFCHASIIGQCFHFAKMRHIQKNQHIKFELLNELDAAAYTEHVIHFSLAGIRALRNPPATNGASICSEL